MFLICLGDLVGIFCSAFFCFTVMPEIISISPAFVRSAYVVLIDYKKYNLSFHQRKTRRLVIIVANCISPLITFFPLIMYRQIMGDTVVSVLLVIFWAFPVFVSFLFYYKSVWVYVLWWISYIGIDP